MHQVSDEASKMAFEELQTIQIDDFRDEASNPEAGFRGERLRSAVKEAGGNKAVAARAGIPISTLGMYIAGREMKVGSAVALARACGVSLNWLATGEDEDRSRTISGSIDADFTMTDATGRSLAVQVKNYAIVPRYGVAASAGNGHVVEDEDLIGYLALDETFLRQVLHRRKQDLVSIEATGDSMEPSIHDGDLLVIDTSVLEIQNSRIYVLEVRGALLVKRLSLKLDGSVVVRSDNLKYEPETVIPSAVDTLRIIGQVVYQAGPVRS
jgi:phage repressor protein C with HTH and peptisase S24 domain